MSFDSPQDPFHPSSQLKGEESVMRRFIVGFLSLVFCLGIIQPVLAQAAQGDWYYGHWNTRTQKNFKALINDFVNRAQPKAGGIMGALSGGTDFHIWVREDNAGTVWNLKVNDPRTQPTSGQLKFLRDQINAKAKACRFSMVAFNRSSPPRLWFFERTDNKTIPCP